MAGENLSGLKGFKIRQKNAEKKAIQIKRPRPESPKKNNSSAPKRADVARKKGLPRDTEKNIQKKGGTGVRVRGKSTRSPHSGRKLAASLTNIARISKKKIYNHSNSRHAPEIIATNKRTGSFDQVKRATEER